jgi:hypothetical protein
VESVETIADLLVEGGADLGSRPLTRSNAPHRRSGEGVQNEESGSASS